MIKTDQNRQILPIVYGVAGIGICLVNLAQADVTHHDDFLYYLLCGVIAALGLRSTHRNAVPVSFLVLLLAIEDLSLPEVIFIACLVSLLSHIRETGRTRLRVSALILSVASGSIGIAAAQMVHQALVGLKYNALFPAPLVASSLVLLLNLSLSRA